MTWPKGERLIYCRREFSMKKGLTIARKVGSRDVICRCREFLMKKGLIDHEKGGLEASCHVDNIVPT